MITSVPRQPDVICARKPAVAAAKRAQIAWGSRSEPQAAKLFGVTLPVLGYLDP
jgi:hypothetical protein